MIHPPKIFLRIFRWYCDPKLRDFIEGDLMEVYQRRAKQSGKLLANSRFIIDVLLLFRPGIIRRRTAHHSINNMAMLKNYLKTGWRNLTKQKMYSAIKAGGLAVGVASCLLIALYIRQELSYDLQNRNADRVYRVLRSSVGDNGERSLGVHFPAGFGEMIKSDYPEIDNAGRYTAEEWMGAGSNEVRRVEQTESLHENRVVYMDQPMLEIMQPVFIYGSVGKALSDPNSVVINRSTYTKYFNHEDPIGKVFIFNNDNKRLFKVSGVIEDLPSTSHLQFDIALGLRDREFYEGESSNWGNMNYPTYIVLRPGASAADLGQKLSSSVSKYFLPYALKGGNDRAIEWTKQLRFELQPIREIYLNKLELRDGLAHGDLRYIFLFGIIAIFILIIACINFINLSTAKSATRAKEVGLRKTVGSSRRSLIMQFLTESLLFSFFSFAAGVFIVWVALPWFNQLTGKSLAVQWTAWWLLPIIACAAVIVGIIAGLYPAVYLSSFRPFAVLKGAPIKGMRGGKLRSALVIFQFTVSIILIAGTLIINRQMNFIFNKKLGFNKDQVVIVEGTRTLENKINGFKAEMLQSPDILAATISGFMPVALTDRNGGPVQLEEREGNDDAANAQVWTVDMDYVKTLGLSIKEGADFTEASPKKSMIINTSLQQALHITNAVGKVVTYASQQWTITGLIDDFHFESMKERIGPLALVLGESRNLVAVKVSPDVHAGLSSIETVWKKFSPDQGFRFTFLDESYARMYEDVKRTGDILTCFTLLAIVVACLGLFALSAFMAEQRGKEISVRMILGASWQSIITLLSIDFLKLVIVAIFIATPIAWYAMHQWLTDFAYKIDITADVFVLSGIAAIIVAVITVSFQSTRAALSNPVKNLRSE